ncbi:SulP family inorganic anion transporter [Portibacter lacus]|uniref:Sodium-independent anion transporter n=1 Tax=Portibacter lacus TaxID=1099794 RepID=A0AA37ST45_9BACT|nr:solute carrier family 26 protein [Portibacter lacus]GLR17688.1 sodium-independent anion transporter [Portibacter lacus]
MKKYFPFLDWIKTYSKAQFGGDLSAGLTVGVMLIPQGMAYSMLAGLPPIYGLYASTIPLIVYALLGTSRQLAVGPVAMVALLISSGVGALAPLGSTEFIALAILLALMVGVIQFSMGAFRLGFLVNFLSHPVIAGFTSAAAIIIGFSQVKHLLGLSIPRGKVHDTIFNIFQNISDINLPTLVIGVGAVILLLLSKKISKRLPGPLIVVLIGMGIVYFMGLDAAGVKIIKDVPGGLPSFGIPNINGKSMIALLPIALTISFVGFMESIAVAKAIQSKHKNYEIDANQELIGLGLSNILGSFFKAFPVTGGFSRTAVNDQAGAKTGVASIISAVLIIITLLFLTEYFYYLPNAVLGAIIVVAVFGLIDFAEAKHLWKHDKKDFAVFMVTAIATLSLGIEEGILVGVVLSLGILIYKVSYPHMAELGQVPGSDEFRNLERFDHLEITDDILIVRFDAQLYFANASSLIEYVEAKIQERPKIKHVIFDFSAVTGIDSSAIHSLKDLVENLHRQERALTLSNVRGPVRDILYRNNMMDSDHAMRFYLSNQDAIKDIKHNAGNEYEQYVSQSNHGKKK